MNCELNSLLAYLDPGTGSIILQIAAAAVLSVGVRPLGPSGKYTVNYRVTSADGHVVSGSWPFHLTTAGTGKPGPVFRRMHALYQDYKAKLAAAPVAAE